MLLQLYLKDGPACRDSLLYVNRYQDPNNILYCQPVLHGPGQQTHGVIIGWVAATHRSTRESYNILVPRRHSGTPPAP